MIAVSVVICSHNPRRDYLERVLGALQAQTLPKNQWELLLIDNASARVLATEWDLNWHLNARHVREDELGLAPARLRGIAEARGGLLVFVDDDNVLDRDYLKNALEIARDYPFLGAWGGIVRGEFETEPPGWFPPFFGYLAIRDFAAPIWSNNPEDCNAQPFGVGLCVRSIVAKAYSTRVATEPLRRQLGLVGMALTACDDSDLAQASCALGKGFGNLPQLRTTHLISRDRLCLDYILRLSKGRMASATVLRYLRSGELPQEPSVIRDAIKYAVMSLRRGWRAARINWASQAGVRMGVRTIRKYRSEDNLRPAAGGSAVSTGGRGEEAAAMRCPGFADSGHR